LFGQTSPTPISPDDLAADVAWKDETLNDSQKNAVRFALASREVALIHGKILWVYYLKAHCLGCMRHLQCAVLYDASAELQNPPQYI
jgi:hypothetical protein